MRARAGARELLLDAVAAATAVLRVCATQRCVLREHCPARARCSSLKPAKNGLGWREGVAQTEERDDAPAPAQAPAGCEM